MLEVKEEKSIEVPGFEQFQTQQKGGRQRLRGGGSDDFFRGSKAVSAGDRGLANVIPGQQTGPETGSGDQKVAAAGT